MNREAIWGFPPDGKEERSLGNLMQQENMHGSARLTNAFLENLRSESQTILTARIATKVLYLLHNFMTWFKSYKIFYSDYLFKNFIWCNKNCCMILSTTFSTLFVMNDPQNSLIHCLSQSFSRQHTPRSSIYGNSAFPRLFLKFQCKDIPP